YDLSGLPSSQHRAGLAGLVLMCRWLEGQARKDLRGTCAIEKLTAHRLVLRLDRDGLASLFDQVYGAVAEERAYPRPFKNKPPLYERTRVETSEKTGKSKEVTDYYYPAIVPGGAYLADWDHNGPWTKLWRDMLWSILRGVPATRAPFEARATRQPTTEADDTLAELGHADTVVDLPSTYFLGAQARTAENVPFRDLARYQFLLHFWPFVAPIYVPAVIDNEGKRSFRGYAIAVPDVSDLELFCEELPDAMRGRGLELAGYVPAQAVVDVAVESALDLLARIGERLRQRGTYQLDLVQGVDVFHVDKEGNNIRLLGMARIDVEPDMVEEYRRLRDAYRDSRFRRQRLLNLVEHRAWYAGFDRLFATTPWEQTMGSPWFRQDSRSALTEIENAMSQQEPNETTLEALIYRIVGTYLSARLSSKYGLEWKNVEADEGRKKEYSEKRKKLANDAFLAIRSRTGSDFVDYFSGTLFSEPQHLDEARYAILARALIEHTDQVRTFTLLALSARA
ncbi:MAG TPA: type I-MYXAN CRISPR-associated protein Cmx8, partial [Haliangium sp.]|nr:type I-MYXAN CRISPR-associated protein Cmx8 [Haliangium sp.]